MTNEDLMMQLLSSSKMLFPFDLCSTFMYFDLAHSVEIYVATFSSHSLQKISY
ncbi:hypothetical protein SCLCIDRAFT_947190 [Scleroderma citrinum Foug A]|uniref:Uncharacterized protein n=1 Tax=Scleroderma citrinum Foug A TaxID=1036808 RepID=A0A0C3DI67_9AGAM|nr:hypothetical protein SCLCIDRAFT_947190 [Scleroderma citrinum Foug A]